MMLKEIATLSMVAVLATGLQSPVFAQTSTSDTPTTEAAPKADDVEEKLAFGEDSDKAPQVGQPYTREVIGAWEMRCIKGAADAAAAEPCQMYQLMDDGKGVPVGEISLFRLPGTGKAEAGATIVVPLETSLANQITVSVDGGKSRRYPYAFCNPVGCYARLGLTKADVAAFKAGKEATISIVPAMAPDQKVDLKLSLEGFTASYNKVSIIEQ